MNNITHFAVCKRYPNNDAYTAFTISNDGFVFGIYTHGGFSPINKPLDDTENVFLKAEVFNDTFLNYGCKPSEDEDEEIKINFRQIKYFIASENGYGFNNQNENNDGFFLKYTTVDNLIYFNFSSYFGNNGEPINLFGKSNTKVTSIVLMPHYLSGDQIIKIYSNAFVIYPNLKNVFIYGDVNYISKNHNLLHKEHNGRINFYFIKPEAALDAKEEYVSNRDLNDYFIEELKNTQTIHKHYKITTSNILFEAFIQKLPALNGPINDQYFINALKYKYWYRRYVALPTKRIATVNPTI